MLSSTPEGPKVEDLAENGKAGPAGVRKDDIIVGMDDEPIKTIDDLKIFLLFKKIGDSVTVRVKRKTGFFIKQDSTLSFPLVL